MNDVTEMHEEKNTFQIDVNIPGHEPRKASALFERTRKEFMDKVGHKCFICGANEAEAGEPLQLHHKIIERCYAEAGIDWDAVKVLAPEFPWDTFDGSNPYLFVDNCHYNGIVLCRKHHTMKDSGIHELPFNIWIMQRLLKNGYQFSTSEKIEHFLT